MKSNLKAFGLAVTMALPSSAVAQEVTLPSFTPSKYSPLVQAYNEKSGVMTIITAPGMPTKSDCEILLRSLSQGVSADAVQASCEAGDTRYIVNEFIHPFDKRPDYYVDDKFDGGIHTTVIYPGWEI